MKSLLKPLILTSLFASGCVSVGINTNKKSPKSDSVVFSEPSKPFEEIKSDTGDKTWLSGKTGNTISYLSECNLNSDSKLEEILTESTSFIDDKKEVSNEEKMYNQRKSVQSVLTGNVDGINVQMFIVIFRKNQCLYTLTYGGTENNFNEEKKIFLNFLDNFKVTQ